MKKFTIICPSCQSSAILTTVWRFAKSKCPSCGMKTYGMIRLSEDTEPTGEYECEARPIGGINK
jgi:predicted RNA-binding Zn-ribbon protein involved in translation (DUF1610 family)